MYLYTVAKNFLLVLEQTSRHGIYGGSVVIRSSGYTMTPESVSESWVRTQSKTLFQEDRLHLSDPLIAPQTPTLKPYKKLDCTVFNLYLRPECKGLKYATDELSHFLDNNLLKYFDNHAFIGFSKGGLIIAAMTQYLKTVTNIMMIAPTFGTIMGDEQLVFQRLDNYLQSQSPKSQFFLTPEIGIYKKVTHIVGSRRPTDYDMSIDSYYLNKELDLSNLSRHNTLLVTARCSPNFFCSFPNAAFRHYGKYLGLAHNADGMVTLQDQMRPLVSVDKCMSIYATHPTALKKASPLIETFLKINFS